jgi:hypothetical protein
MASQWFADVPAVPGSLLFAVLAVAGFSAVAGVTAVAGVSTVAGVLLLSQPLMF